MCPQKHSVTNGPSVKLVSVHSKGDSPRNLGLVDDAFDPKRSDSYHLSIELSVRSISFCVLDTLGNKYLALHHESVTGEGITGAVNHLIQMLQTHELLRPSYKSTSLVLVDERFTTVPAPLYDKSKKHTFLDFNIHGGGAPTHESTLFVDKLQGIEAYNVYALPNEVLGNLQAAFGNVRILHHTTCLIDTLLGLHKNQNRETCFLHIQEGLFSILFIDGNELKFCNNFLYNSKEDLAYYTLFVCEQLKLNPESVEMILLGERGKDSQEYRILYSYIRNLRFINRNPGFTYSYKMDEVPGHYHFNLFSLFDCVS